MTSTGTTHQPGVEWAGAGHADDQAERDSRGWPILHAANDPCDGKHPPTGQLCTRGYHKGLHRAGDGTEWLDDE